MTIVYDSIDALWIEATSSLLNYGDLHVSRAGKTLELCGHAMRLTDLDRNFLLNPVRNLSPVYGSAELLWYLSGTNDISMLKHYAPSYTNFAQADGTAYGAYGYRISRGLWASTSGMVDENLLSLALWELQKSPHSRQCVISLWHPVDLANAYEGMMRDVPCTISWQFLVRNGSLHMVCGMRSNDVWLGLPYDIYCNTMIQRMMAGELKLKLGYYTHFVGSLHIYERNIEKAQEAVKWVSSEQLPKHMYPACGFEGLDTVLEIERAVRTDSHYETQTIPRSPVLDDAAHLCALHNGYEVCNSCLSPLLEKAYHDHRGRKRQGRQDDIVREDSK